MTQNMSKKDMQNMIDKMSEGAISQIQRLRECDERNRELQRKIDEERYRKSIWVFYGMFTTMVIAVVIVEYLL